MSDTTKQSIGILHEGNLCENKTGLYLSCDLCSALAPTAAIEYPLNLPHYNLSCSSLFSSFDIQVELTKSDEHRRGERETKNSSRILLRIHFVDDFKIFYKLG